MGSLKIFHCADLHLGLRFKRYPEGLAEARFRTLETMVEKANAEGCDLFVVAGDLFDTLKVPARDVARAAKILAQFAKVTCVLPGNHDFHTGQGDDFWKNFSLPEHGRMALLSEAKPYPLQDFGLDAVVYAAPCQSKYSKTHAVGWLDGFERLPGKFQIGIAHGSFEGLSPDMQGEYFPMKASDLTRHQLDLWMLGHIHLQFPPRSPGPGERIFYSGTHEPDGFDCRHEGKAWLLELGEDKSLKAESLSTGQFRFRHEELELRELAELEKFSARLPPAEAKFLLLKLRIFGALPREEFEKFGETLERLKSRLHYLEADFAGLSVSLSPADIDRAFARESFPHRLLSDLAVSPSDKEALQAAYEMLRSLEGRA